MAAPFDNRTLEPRVLLDAAALYTAASDVPDTSDDTSGNHSSTDDQQQDKVLLFSGAVQPVSKTSLVVVDAGREDAADLLENVSGYTRLDIAQNEDGIEAVTNYLTDNKGAIDAVHLLPGTQASSVSLGSAIITPENLLENYGAEFTAWQQNLADDTSVSIWVQDAGAQPLDKADFEPLFDTVEVKEMPVAPVAAAKAGFDAPIAALSGGASFTVLNSGVSLNEGASVTLTTSHLNVTDPDSSANEIFFSITAETLAEGQLRLNGSEIGVGDQFTLQDIIDGNVAYVHGGAEPANAETVTFTITDGAPGTPGINTQTGVVFSVGVDALNDAPQVNAGSATVAEGVEGSLTDYTLTASDLNISDEETAASNLTVTLNSIPTDGVLLISGATASAGDTFTVQDIADGNITFRHNGSEAATDTFLFSVSDGTNTVSGVTFTFNVTPFNDPYELTNEGLLFNEGSTNVITTGNLNVEDVDTDPASIIFTIDSLTFPEGVLQNNGVTLSVSDTFTLADVQAGLLSFVHDGSESVSDHSFNFTVTDGSTVTPGQTFGIRVSPVNDDPVLSAPGLTLDEGATANFALTNFGVTDPDNTDLQIIYRITDLPDHGTLRFNGNAVVVGSTFSQQDLTGLSYNHDGSEDHSDGFRVTIEDGAGGVLSNELIGITVNPINDDFSVSSSNSVNEGQSTTVSLNINDVDDADADVSVEFLSLPADGTLTLNGSPVTIGQTVTANQLANLVYTHDGNDANGGNPPDVSFEVRVTDSGGGEGAGAAITRTVTVGIDVVPVNDDPVLETNAGLTLDNGTTAAITNAMLDVSDVDSSDINLVYQLRTIPSEGLVVLNGVPLGVGATFSQADIDSGALTYQSFSGGSTSDSFNFSVTDSTVNRITGQLGAVGGSQTPSVETFNITINNPSVPTTPGAGDADAEDDIVVTSEDVAINIAEATLTDNDFGTSPDIISVQAAVNGTVTLVGDTVTFTPAPEFSGTASFTYTIQADNGTTDTATVTVHVLDVNDAPDQGVGVGANTGATLDEGATVTITTAMLEYEDIDNVQVDLLYTVTSLPAGGSLFVGGSELGSHGTFTQSDIDAGRVEYRHAGGEVFAPSFSFTVSDGGVTTQTGTFNFSVNPVNDQPSSSSGYRALAENTEVSLSLSELGISDVDGVGDDIGLAEDALTVQFSTLPTAGELYVDNGSTRTLVTTSTIITRADIDAGFLRYVHDGTETFADTAQFTVDDNSGAPNATATGTVTFDVSPINDDPVVATNSPLTIFEGETVTITAANLDSLDPDNVDLQEQFRVDAAPEHGGLFLNNTQLSVGSVFSRADLLAGNVTYVHSGNEATVDTFDFTLRDGGGGTYPSGTFTINIQSINDTPEVEAPTALTAEEDTAITIAGLSVADEDSVDPSSGNITSSFGPMEVTLSVSNGSLTFGTVTGLSFEGGTANGDASIVVRGSIGDLNAALATLSYTGDLNYIGSDTLNFAVNDLGNTGFDPEDPVVPSPVVTNGDLSNETASTTVAINVIAVNDPPVVTVPGPETLYEDQSTTLTGFSFDDHEAGASDILELTLRVNEGSITLATTSGVSIVSGSNGSDTIVIRGTMTALATAVNGLTYAPDADYAGADTLSVTLSDLGIGGEAGGVRTTTETVAITVDAVNDTPAITTDMSGTQTAFEDTPFNFGLSGQQVTLADIDSASGNLQLTITSSNADGLLQLDSLTSLIVGGANNSTNLVLQGTLAQLNQAVDALNYVWQQDADGTGTVTFELQDGGNTGADPDSPGVPSDGDDDGDTNTSFELASLTVNFNTSRANDAPVVATPPDVALDEDQPGITFGNISFTDEDSTGNMTVTVEVAQGTVSLNAGAATTAAAAGLVTSGEGTDTITLTGSLANLNSFLNQTDAFVYGPALNVNGDIEVTVTVDDGGGPGADGSNIPNRDDTGTNTSEDGTATFDLNIRAVNDAPELTVPASVNSFEGIDFTFENSEALDLVDVDSASGTISVSLSVSNGTLALASTSGIAVTAGANESASMTIEGTVAAVSAAIENLVYSADAGFNGTDTLNISVNDGGNTGADPDDAGVHAGGVDDGDADTTFEVDSASVTINVQAVNELPTIALDETTQTVSGPLTLTAGVNGIAIDDPDLQDLNAVDQFELTIAGVGDNIVFSAGSGATIVDNSSGNNLSYVLTGCLLYTSPSPRDS